MFESSFELTLVPGVVSAAPEDALAFALVAFPFTVVPFAINHE